MGHLIEWRPRLGFYQWASLLAGCMGYLFVSLSRYGPAVIAPELTREFALGPAELAFVVSVHLWAYGAIQMPTGLLADTLGPRRAMTFFLLLAAVGSFLFAAAGSYQMAVAGRIIAGLGTGVVFVCTMRVVANWFPSNRFAMFNGVILMIGHVGTVVAAAPLALLVGGFGWRFGFQVLTVLACAVALLVFSLVRDSPAAVTGSKKELTTDSSASVSGREPLLRQVLESVLPNRSLWLISAYAIGLFGVQMTMQGLLTVPYLMDVYGVSRQEASNVLTMWAVGMIVGCPLSGYVSDSILRRRKPVVLGGVSLLALPFVLLSVFPAQLPLWTFYLLFMFCGLTCGTATVAYALVKDIVPRQVVGTALGIYNAWLFIGAALFQQAAGLILSLFPVASGQGSVTGYRMVFLLCLLSLGMASLAVSAVRERVVDSSSISRVVSLEEQSAGPSNVISR